MQPSAMMRQPPEEDDPKHPHPVHVRKKELNAPEAAEARPWVHLKDEDRDHHRHVC